MTEACDNMGWKWGSWQWRLTSMPPAFHIPPFFKIAPLRDYLELGEEVFSFHKAMKRDINKLSKSTSVL
jgi:hypothetical protein